MWKTEARFVFRQRYWEKFLSEYLLENYVLNLYIQSLFRICFCQFGVPLTSIFVFINSLKHKHIKKLWVSREQSEHHIYFFSLFFMTHDTIKYRKHCFKNKIYHVTFLKLLTCTFIFCSFSNEVNRYMKINSIISSYNTS